MTPCKLGAKEFENLLLEGARRHAKDGSLTMNRYGVQVAMIDNAWQPVPSLPDFDGVTGPDGQQFIIEAKVVSVASFRMRKDFIKPRQVAHMLERAAFGVRSFLVVHFNERIGQTFHDPAETIALPVNDGWELWSDFLEGKPVTPINREMASRKGYRIEWTAPGRAKKALPDLAGLLSATNPQQSCL